MILLTDLPTHIKWDILEHFNSKMPEEACGLLVKPDNAPLYFKPCTNVSNDRQATFTIDSDDFALAEMSGDIRAIVHSHCYIPAEPSAADLASCEATNVPWIIVSLPNNDWVCTYPKAFDAPYQDRHFVHGVMDCYTLVRDWYFRELGIRLPSHMEATENEWEDKWWEKEGKELYLTNFARYGFERVPEGEPLVHGDVILMCIGSSRANHAAIYLGDGNILHHLTNRYSRLDIYGGYWKKNTRAIVRHKG